MYNPIRLPEKKISATVKDTHLGLSFRDSEDFEARASAIFVVLKKSGRKKNPASIRKIRTFIQISVFSKKDKKALEFPCSISYIVPYTSPTLKKSVQKIEVYKATRPERKF